MILFHARSSSEQSVVILGQGKRRRHVNVRSQTMIRDYTPNLDGNGSLGRAAT